jgi:hypothetical protein
VVNNYTNNSNVCSIAKAFSNSLKSRFDYVTSDPIFLCASIMDPLEAFTCSDPNDTELTKAQFKIHFTYFITSLKIKSS